MTLLLIIATNIFRAIIYILCRLVIDTNECTPNSIFIANILQRVAFTFAFAFYIRVKMARPDADEC